MKAAVWDCFNSSAVFSKLYGPGQMVALNSGSSAPSSKNFSILYHLFLSLPVNEGAFL